MFKGKRDYKNRIIGQKIIEYLECFGAVCIEGPKYSGKTWTSSHYASSAIFLGDPTNNFSNRNLAMISPDSILDGEKPRLIDEWQEVPLIWDAVRHYVDQFTEKGLIILTGSSTPNFKGVLHSGIDRIAKIRIRTMSLYESGDSSGKISLKDLFEGRLESQMIPQTKIQDIIHFIIRGGFPGNLTTSKTKAHLLAKEYVDTLITDEIFRMGEVTRDYSKMRSLLSSLARNECTTVSNTKLSQDITRIEEKSIDQNTIAKYLDILERLFICDNVDAFSTNIRSATRLKQSQKRHLVDPSLAAALLNVDENKLLADLNTLGFLFESLVIRDIKVYAEANDAKVYHYQDYKNREIGIIVELDDGNYIAIEVKLGSNQIDDAAKKLVSLKEELIKEGAIAPKELIIICGVINSAYKRTDGVMVVPITALKD